MSLTEPFGCTPAAMPVGSGAQAHGDTMRSASAPPMADPLASSMYTPCTAGLQRLFPSSRPNARPRVRCLFGVGPGTARRYLQSPLHKPIWAQHILTTFVANTLIWNGFSSHYGLQHTTPTSAHPCQLFLNSTIRLPIVYRHPVGATPTRPRHED